jgi:hypothetical protein
LFVSRFCEGEFVSYKKQTLYFGRTYEIKLIALKDVKLISFVNSYATP